MSIHVANGRFSFFFFFQVVYQFGLCLKCLFRVPVLFNDLSIYFVALSPGNFIFLIEG